LRPSRWRQHVSGAAPDSLKSPGDYAPALTTRRLPCEYCGEPLADPIEEPFNLAFIAHLKGSARCMELFSYGMANLRNELALRLGKKPSVDGI
jgi:hypothetical protein